MFVTTLLVSHPLLDDWTDQYLTTESHRLLTIAAPFIPEGHRRLYDETYLDIMPDVLFRAKVINQTLKRLELTNVYTSKSVYDGFKAAIDGDVWFAAYDSAGLAWELKERDEVTDTEVFALIEDIMACDTKIIQRVDIKYQLSGMVIGDPLRGDKVLITIT